MYELILGERRYRASKLAGKADIPAMIKHADDDAAVESKSSKPALTYTRAKYEMSLSATNLLNRN